MMYIDPARVSTYAPSGCTRVALQRRVYPYKVETYFGASAVKEGEKMNKFRMMAKRCIDGAKSRAYILYAGRVTAPGGVFRAFCSLLRLYLRQECQEG